MTHLDRDCPACRAKLGEDCWVAMSPAGDPIGEIVDVAGVWTHSARLAPSEKRRTLCVECGPDVAIDEDGCCRACGNGAVGGWLDRTPSWKRVIAVVDAARAVRHAWLSMNPVNTYQRDSRDELDVAIDHLDAPCGCPETCPQIDPCRITHEPGCPQRAGGDR